MTGSRPFFKLVHRGVDTVPMQYAGEGEAAKTRAEIVICCSNKMFPSINSDISLAIIVTIYRYLVKPDFSLPWW